MKKIVLLMLFAFGMMHLVDAQSKSGYTIQGAKKSKPGGGTSALKDKVVVGFSPSLSAGSNYFYLGLTPTVGYKITNEWVAGVGLTYSFQRYFKENYDNYGSNLFTRYTFNEKYIIAASYDWINYKYLARTSQGVEKLSKWYNAIFLGGGINQPIGRNGSFQLLVLYNLKYDKTVGADNGPYNSPILFIPGFYYNF